MLSRRYATKPLVPKKSRPAMSPFGDTSDIDVTIISSDLFLILWREALAFAEERGDWAKIDAFRAYLMRGWIRPDKLPTDSEFKSSHKWFDFFRGLQQSGKYGRYPIRAGVYFDEYFWEAYARSSLEKCRDAIERPL